MKSCNRSVNLKLLARDTGVSLKNEMLPILRVLPLRIFQRWMITGILIPAIAQSHIDDAKLINYLPRLFRCFKKLIRTLSRGSCMSTSS
jgi:hypothetical protein